MRIRMVVEYDPDWVPELGYERALEEEKKAWVEGDVDVYDIIQVGGKVTWEVIQ